jgi:hypothetical protein
LKGIFVDGCLEKGWEFGWVVSIYLWIWWFCGWFVKHSLETEKGVGLGALYTSEYGGFVDGLLMVLCN